MKLKSVLAPIVGVAALSLPLLLTPQVGLAQKTKATAKLPSAEKVMDESFAATGNKAALSAIKSAVMKGKVLLPAQNITGTFELQTKAPNKIYVKQTMGGIGTFEQGFDGKVGWSRDPINGLRTLASGELTQLKSQGDDVKSADWRALYSKAEMLGLRKVGATNAYAIRLTPKTGGKTVVSFIDTKTKLPVRMDVVIVSAQGSVPTQSFPSDYRVVNGIKIAFKTRSVAGPQEIVQTFDSVTFNQPVADAVFAKPTAPAPKQ